MAEIVVQNVNSYHFIANESSYNDMIQSFSADIVKDTVTNKVKLKIDIFFKSQITNLANEACNFVHIDLSRCWATNVTFKDGYTLSPISISKEDVNRKVTFETPFFDKSYVNKVINYFLYNTANYKWYFSARYMDSFSNAGYATGTIKPINDLKIQESWYNTQPIITLNTTNNSMLYENSTFTVDGRATDTDSGNIIYIKYQINSGSIQTLTSITSTGSEFNFSKQLTYKDGKLFDGSTAVTNTLSEGATHTLKVWAEDNQGGKSTEQVRTFNVVPNKTPTITVNTANNLTLYENGLFIIDGATTDADNGNAITIKYQIDSGTVQNLYSAISNGVNPIVFSKSLTYSEGVLKDGSTVLTSVLSKDTPHTLSIWAEDDKGGKSSILTRTFYVVPNRPPILTIDPITAQSDLINSNTITVSGSAGDADNNNVTVTFKINDDEALQVYTGPPSNWTFNIMLKDLNTGANTLKIEVTDSYNAKVSKVLTINKTHDAVPVNQASALYKITPPTGSASRILLWIERLLGDLAIATEVSMTNAGEPENFVPLTRTNTAPIDTNTQEDEFAYDAGAAKTNIILKVTYSRSDAKSVQTIKKLSGVLS